jgi:hypothetical protein
MNAGSYPLEAEALRCTCGQLPVMEWKNSGNAHRVVCTGCQKGSDLTFYTFHRRGWSTREQALYRWKKSVQPEEP